MPRVAAARSQLPVDVFASTSGALHRAIPINELFAFKRQLLIGRTADCDICLPHHSVSRRHALLERLPQGVGLRDLGSMNGVLVGGRRMSEPGVLRERERIGIGPYLLCLIGGELHALDSSRSLRLEARGLEKVVTTERGQVRKLLENINLAVEPGEFVSLLGPSGSGKSTLMDCLNGRRPATGGQVLANGEDFYRHFDSFRQSLGYVPQRDIVHTQLAVDRALYYTARLRLPADTAPAELSARMNEVIRLMDLEAQRSTLVGNLSGGQIKRVSLGAELVGRPCLLYIDEATSGLDASTEARMMRLFRDLARSGKTILCITHHLDHIELCDLILILAAGRLVYFGPPAEAGAFFQTQKIAEIYDVLPAKPAADWEKQFAASSLYREFVDKRLAAAPEGSMLGAIHPPSRPLAKGGMGGSFSQRTHVPWLHQCRVLTARYAELLLRDVRTLRLLLLQAPLVAVVVLLGFSNKPYRSEILAVRRLQPHEREVLQRWLERMDESEASSGSVPQDPARVGRDAAEVAEFREATAKLQWVRDPGELRAHIQLLLRMEGPLVPERLIVNPTYTYILLFLLVIIVLWFGCANAAKEIVKEEAIYARERAVNLGIMPYLASKFIVLSAISAVQVFLLMGVVYGVLALLHLTLGHDLPPSMYRLDYAAQYGMLVLLSMTGVALGLLLSASVSNPDRASTLLPYVLIPQIILGGGVIKVENEPLRTIAHLGSPAYWAFRAIRMGETTLPADFPWHVDYNDSIWLACAALAAQMLLCLLLTAWCLRRKDAQRG